MRALCWHGKGDVRVDTVPDPKIEHPRDAIIKITACAICGSDLHLLDGYQPTMESGDILGHENMGEVIELGSEVTNLKIGDRVVVPFTISCGQCWFCQKGLFSCCDRTNPECRDGDQGDGPFAGRTVRLQPHARRLFSGGQAEYLRVPMADVGPIKIPDSVTDEQALFLSDIFPDRLHGGGERADRAGRHRRDLGLRAGRPVRHPLGADDGRRPRHRDRRSAGAACHGGGRRRRDDRFLQDRCLRRADGADGQARSRQLHRCGRLRGLRARRRRRGARQGEGR